MMVSRIRSFVNQPRDKSDINQHWTVKAVCLFVFLWIVCLIVDQRFCFLPADVELDSKQMEEGTSSSSRCSGKTPTNHLQAVSLIFFYFNLTKYQPRFRDVAVSLCDECVAVTGLHRSKMMDPLQAQNIYVYF